MSCSVADYLSVARRDLLDLSTRNRLIHTRRSTKSAGSVEIVDEQADQVCARLIGERKPMSFSPRAANDDRDDGEAPLVAADELAQPLEESTAPDPARHRDDKLQTALVTQKLQNRLLRLFYDARTFEEEQGVNILFLAIGFLKWFEDDRSTTERYAPLLLVPVKLERQTAGTKFKLLALDEDISTNLSLAAKLKHEFNIDLPEVPETEDLVPSAYFERVRAAIAGQQRWEVLPNDMVLWFFSFAKFLMYRDLDPATWPENSLIEQPNIAAVVEGGFRSDPPIFDDDDKLDAVLDPAELAHVVDADSSQAVVVEEVRRGQHLVVQGPPGTGKSQTITNMIAAAVKEGKKVLFVAEKMAALEVVKNRLDKIGLGAMCLELHSHKANKKALLAELEATLNLTRPKLTKLDEQVGELRRVRDRLNNHASALHERLEPCGVTAYEVIGQLVRLHAAGTPPASCAHHDPLAWTKQQAAQKGALVAEVAAALAKVGVPAEHPWRGVTLASLLPNDVTRIAETARQLAPRIEHLRLAGEALAAALHVRAPANVRQLYALVRLARHLLVAPPLDRQAIAHEAWTSQAALVDEAIAIGEELAAARSALAGEVEDHAWTTEIGPARKVLALRGKSWLRWLHSDYRRAVATLRTVCVAAPPRELDQRLAICDQLLAGQRALARLAPGTPHDQVGRSVFGNLWHGPESNCQQLRAIQKWVEAAQQANVAANFRQVAAACETFETCEPLLGAIDAQLAVVSDVQALAARAELNLQRAFGEAELADVALVTLRDRFLAWAAAPEGAQAWVSYYARHARLAEEGLGSLAAEIEAGRVDASAAVGQFWMAYYEALLRACYSRFPALADFHGDAHEQARIDFQRLDKLRIELARKEVAFAHYQTVPNDGTLGEMGTLRHEMKKKIRHMPIRKLLAKAGHAIQAIKPVFMMSPISIAQFLEQGGLTFDLLVIDEASQVRPVEAFGGLARAKQIVVVGDDKQMPPTSFFQALGEADEHDEEDESLYAGDLESILGLCIARNIRSRLLAWHYRSKHHSLIAVSNCEFYDNRLHVVPNPAPAADGMGLMFHHVADGVFDRGGSSTNRVEAQRIAAAVMRHAREFPDLSLGVGAFSVKQRDVIIDELEVLRRHEPALEPFFSTGASEPFFVKNLENLQGDERDVIFISVGYGRDKSGYMAMNFGPLNADGGERRLNVLISRARRRCEVFSSITAADIDLARAKGRGVAALKRFLKFAQTQELDLPRATGREHDSAFEEEVAQAIAECGYDCDAQVGTAGFFVDLAVKDPDQPGRYLLGVECDGATYHSARWARDRDRLRQQVLEDRGWRMYRIWSTDWFLDPAEQTRALKAAIEAARSNVPAIAPPTTNSPGATIEAEDNQGVDGAAAGEHGDDDFVVVLYEEAAPRHLPRGRIDTSRPLHEAPLDKLAEVAVAVVRVEGPVHREEVARRVADFWGAQRTTQKMLDAVADALTFAVQIGRIAAAGDFYYVPGQSPPVRSRESVTSATLRQPEMLPPLEVATALERVVERHVGVTADEAVIATSRLLGYRTTGAQLRRVIMSELERLLAEGRLLLRQEKLFAAQ